MGDDDRSLEQQASEDLAELEAEESSTDWTRHLNRMSAEHEAMKRTVHALVDDMMAMKRRLDRQLPMGGGHNCRFCGRILRTPGGKCSVCGKQN